MEIKDAGGNNDPKKVLILFLAFLRSFLAPAVNLRLRLVAKQSLKNIKMFKEIKRVSSCRVTGI